MQAMKDLTDKKMEEKRISGHEIFCCSQYRMSQNESPTYRRPM